MKGNGALAEPDRWLRQMCRPLGWMRWELMYRWLTHTGKYVSPAGLWDAIGCILLVLSAAVLVLDRWLALVVCDPCGVEGVCFGVYPRMRCATRGILL